jgi:hypothetical protein
METAMRMRLIVTAALLLGTACSEPSGSAGIFTAGGTNSSAETSTQTASDSGASATATASATEGMETSDTSDGMETASESDASTDTNTDGPNLDVVASDGSGGDGDGDCGFDDHTPCDAVDGDVFAAMGLNCPGEWSVSGTTNADPLGVRVIDQWGTASTYTPREGDAFLALSTGDLNEMNSVPANEGDSGLHCNSWFSGGGTTPTSWPPPIQINPTSGDCLANPGLVGSGDCSGTIQDQFNASGFKYDYQEVRFTTTVPEGANGLSFDVAFLTKEYPIWLNSPYNDMFVAWLESSNWSGNISFDGGGNALSLKAAFMEHFDDNGDLGEFEGTCMRYSAGTGWLESSIEVIPGDEITLVFAIFDLDDVNWDSIVFVDNFQWACEGGGGPSTIPID